MARGSVILITGDPKGKFLEGTIDDTSKPGTIMQVTPGTTLLGGEPHFQAASPGADGDMCQQIVLLEDSMQGKLVTDAYVSGTRCFCYVPAGGEDVNILLDEGAGTSNTVAVGDRFMMDSDSGIPIPATAGAGIYKPWTAMEAFTQQTSPQLTWCRFNG